MAHSLSSQIKTKLGLLGSPLVKTNDPNPSQQPFTRVSQNNPSTRDLKNTSNSPDEQRSGAHIQRFQLKNFAFIPAKGISPPSHQQTNTLAYNLTNLNANGDQQTKISPSRLLNNSSTSGNKIVIPAHQIKLVKKDGTSPSPDGRVTNTIVKQNVSQNMNPNIVNQKAMKKVQQSPTSDEDASVLSDSEDKLSNFNMLKSDSSSNNFNRPKLNTNQQRGNFNCFTDPQVSQQLTKRFDQQTQRVKVISPHMIRQSPSPPHSNNQIAQILKNNNNNQMQEQQPINLTNQHQKPTALAADFIKGMINQSRQQNSQNLQQTQSTQKKIIGIGGLKIKKQENSPSSSGLISTMGNFMKDFKRLVTERNKANEQETSPVLTSGSRIQEQDQKPILTIQKGQLQHFRNYSPPPNFRQMAPTNIHKITSKEKLSPQENSPTAMSTQDETTQQTPHLPEEPAPPTNQSDSQNPIFKFPFQRRARSLSNSKQEIIVTKMSQQQNNANQQQNKSPSPGPEDNKRNKPVVAKVNFVIAQKGALGNAYKSIYQQDDSVFERNKEVDEWLMGSGESAATALSNTSTSQGGPLVQTIQQLTRRKSDLEKPVQPSNCINELDDDDASSDKSSQGGKDDEDWMFQTFEAQKAKRAKKDKVERVQRTRQNDFELDEDDPFEMAPEMSKQFVKGGGKGDNCFILDMIASECDDLSQYIDKIDQIMENIQ